MSLRDRIARVLCAMSPANTEGSAFEDYAECNQREWLETADAILSDPEIAALQEVATLATCIRLNEEMLLEEPSESVDRRISILAMHRANLDAALARLEEARK